jgi:hypothetical protein
MDVGQALRIVRFDHVQDVIDSGALEDTTCGALLSVRLRVAYWNVHVS